MKILEVNDLRSLESSFPLYAVFDKNKIGEEDPRACGCASLALLNTVLFLKNKLKIQDTKSAFDELSIIQKMTKEENNTVQPEKMFEFMEWHPVFNSCRMLVLNPNAMNEEVFLRIFLTRMMRGQAILALMEIPDEGASAQNIINHASFVHSENGEVYFDGLSVDLDFLLRAFYFSKPTTLVFFSINSRGHNG